MPVYTGMTHNRKPRVLEVRARLREKIGQNYAWNNKDRSCTITRVANSKYGNKDARRRQRQ